jgi:hypothetical protein
MTEMKMGLKKEKHQKIKIKKLPVTRQSKCGTCEKNQNCYGSRYCQQNFNPASFLENKTKK